MKGDRERCLAGGMDEYPSKPVQRTELQRILSWAADRLDEMAGSMVQTPTTVKALEPALVEHEGVWFDRDSALERLGGDEELFAEVAGVFRDDSPKMLDDLKQAIAANDAVAVRRTAHGLKGAAGYVGGTKVAETAVEIERLGAANELAETSRLFADLEREVIRLSGVLARASQPVAL